MADYEPEIKDLANPKDELEQKIVALADTMRKWNDETVRVRKTVKEQFKEILDLGLNKRKMGKTELRRFIEEIFRYYSVSESWLRKLLPVELKDSSKIRISYQQRHNIEKESQRLLQLQQQQESEISESIHPKVESLSYQSNKAEIRTELEFPESQNHARLSSSDSKEPYKVFDELGNDSKNEIKKLEAELRHLSEQFVARTTLQAYREAFPLIAHIDPVKKEITWIRFEKGSGI